MVWGLDVSEKNIENFIHLGGLPAGKWRGLGEGWSQGSVLRFLEENLFISKEEAQGIDREPTGRKEQAHSSVACATEVVGGKHVSSLKPNFSKTHGLFSSGLKDLVINYGYKGKEGLKLFLVEDLGHSEVIKGKGWKVPLHAGVC